jgi:exopolysaccharide biosynthesis polyprenyl glycosylphosphotransferase
MNATERAALYRGVELYDEMNAAVDDRTLEIIDRRRRTARVKGRGWLVRRMLVAADLIGLTLAFTAAEALFGPGHGVRDTFNAQQEYLLFLVTLPGWVVVAKLYGLYDRDEERTDHSTADDLVGVFHMVTVGSWLFLTVSWLTNIAHPNFGRLLVFWAFSVIAVTVARVSGRALARRNIAYLQNTVIVGAGDVGQTIARKLLHHPEYGINLVGFVDAEPKARRDDLEHLTLLGPSERLPAIVRLFDVERVIIAFSNENHTDSLDLIRSMKDLEIQVDVVPRLFELVGPGVGIHTIEGLPLVGLAPPRLANSSKALKRAMDLLISMVGLIVFAPVFAIIAMLIKLDSRGPVFFRQVRMGQGDKTFRIFKFRTMTADAEARKHEVAHLNKHLRNGRDPRMFKINGDPRVTRIGRCLRRYSLDEFPQLINVARGEMSLVGPRPLILDEDQYVDTWGRDRLHLKPGCTGVWQVLGRSDIPFDEMLRLDYLYVTGWSVWRDLQLIGRTAAVLFRPDC